jgi:predicted dehydrogenase
VELVVVPTPNGTHYPLAAQALAAGKHVVVDKPFTLSAAEAVRLTHQAEAAGRVLSVFHNRRWDSDFLTLREVLASGQLGPVAHFESHFDRYRPEVKARWRESPVPGSGLWYDLGSHLLDQLLQLFGPPEGLALELAMQRQGSQVDDWFHATLRYGRMRAVLHAGVLVPRPGPRFIVHGERGTFLKGGLDPQEDQLKADRTPRAPDWGQAELSFWDGGTCTRRLLPCRPGDYPAYYAGLRDAILGAGPNPVPPAEALAVMQLLELGLRSAESRRWLPVDAGF